MGRNAYGTKERKYQKGLQKDKQKETEKQKAHAFRPGLAGNHFRNRGYKNNDRKDTGGQTGKTAGPGHPGERQFYRRAPFDVNLLDVNEYSRPGIPLKKIKGVVVHYTANPGSTAAENRNYFEGLKDSHETKVSSHFVIGIEGEIVQCIPSSEIAYASNSRNDDTLSIECCHKDETGEFTQATYDSLVKLVGWLCYRFDLKSSDVIRHYDVTEKICPKYFVDHPDAWEQFKKDVDGQIQVVAEEVKAAEG